MALANGEITELDRPAGNGRSEKDGKGDRS